MNLRLRSACCSLSLALVALTPARGAGTTEVVATGLTIERAIDLSLEQNPAVLKARTDLQRTRGLIVEVRAAALPQLVASGSYRRIDEGYIDLFPGSSNSLTGNQTQPWITQVEISQLLYAGGRVTAAVRAAKLADQIAVLDFARVVADAVLEVRLVFYEILLDTELVGVREQSARLLEQQLADTRHRFDAGTVPQFNVLRAEVELANAQPPLIRTRNDLRLAKERLAKLLALDARTPPAGFTALTLAGELRDDPCEWTIEEALRHALAQRPELQQVQKTIAINREGVRVARAGYQPEITGFAEYGLRDFLYANDVGQTTHGWIIGARASWNLFDGLLTKGKVQQARAELAKAEIDSADQRRTVELEVRQAYSDYLQARELIQAQARTVDQALEGLRLAEARFRAGTGTQLEVLSAQTALTDARSNKVQALYDCNVALAQLDRATGAAVRQPAAP